MAITVTKGSNCTYNFANSDGSPVDINIDVLGASSTYTDEYDGTIPATDNIDYTFTSDGVYRVQFTGGVIMVFVDCDLDTCRDNLVDDILCDTCNPCDIRNFGSMGLGFDTIYDLIDSDSDFKTMGTKVSLSADDQALLDDIYTLMTEVGKYCTYRADDENNCNC